MTDPTHILDADAQAIFLLCGHFGTHDDSSVKPLTRNQYNKVANWLNNKGMRPRYLLQEDGRDALSVFGSSGTLNEKRLQSLLQRGAALAMSIEEWTNKGGWVRARSDEDYPTRFRQRLRHLAPPILYGIGDAGLLEHGGVSMVGSRDSSDEALTFVRKLATKCAREGVSVVSGGARGVDRVSMESALNAGGLVVGALANGLARTARTKKYRNAIAENRLTLISAYHPKSRFAVWKAMGRNKHIYTLGDRTVAAHSAAGSGGTWAGATENLKHEWVPLFVYTGSPVPEGNRKLIEMGAHPIDERILQDDMTIKAWMAGEAVPKEKSAASADKSATDEEQNLQEPARSSSPSKDGQNRPEDDQDRNDTADAESLTDASADDRSSVLFPLVWPTIRPLLETRRSEREVRDHFDDLRLAQARDWLMMAVERGLAVREEGPVRYVLPEETEEDQTSTVELTEAPDPSEDERDDLKESPLRMNRTRPGLFDASPKG